MKIADIINEMTMKAGSFNGLGRYINQYSNLNKSGVFAGDIEQYKVFRFDDITGRYAVFDNDQVIAYWQIDPSGVLNVVYVLPAYRKLGLFSAILFFLKRNEGFSKIILGEYHSDDTYNAIQRIYKRFTNVYWEKDDEKIPYNPLTVDQYYSLTGPSGWKIVLEHTGQFNESKTFNPMQLGTWYFNLLEW